MATLPAFTKIRNPLSCSHKGTSYIQFTSSGTSCLKLIAGFTSHTSPAQLRRLLLANSACASRKSHFLRNHSWILLLQLLLRSLDYVMGEGGVFLHLSHCFHFLNLLNRKKATIKQSDCISHCCSDCRKIT
jgi:hypothetical protein